jgi:acyl carrier protein
VQTDKNQECTAQLKAVISNVLNIQEHQLGPNPAVYRTPGWDSLATVEIVARIEEVLKISVPDRIITETIDLRSLVQYLAIEINSESLPKLPEA